MLGEVVVRIEQGTYTTTKQDPSRAVYYPLRFPDDGLIFFDQFTAEQIHNRIRALTEPYPCAYTFFKKRKVKLVTSELHDQNYFGESGRVYRKTNRGLLVCASDRCLWITNAVFEDTGERVIEVAKRYEVFATLRRAAEEWYASDTLRGGSEQAADGNN